MKQHVLVIGLGLSGCSAAHFLLNKGFHVVAFDQNKATRADARVVALQKKGMLLLEGETQHSSWDFVVVSPGVPREHFLYRRALEKGIEVIGEIELACRYLTHPLFGITGTNGKTTVALLIGHVLNSSGRKARVVGNVGTPLTSVFSDLQDDEILVCELSSFQLETMWSQVFHGGIILNITPDHLDRYEGDLHAYAAAKIHLQHCLKPGAPFYIEWTAWRDFKDLFNRKSPKTYGYSSRCDLFTDKKSVFYQETIEFLLPNQYRDRASHDVENIMGAFALCREIGVPSTDFERALHTFVKPPHRIEFVVVIRGVRFFNDSKGTNIDAVVRAVASMEGKVVLIAGGVDKKVSCRPWNKAFGNKVKSICAIGQTKEQIKKELDYPVILCSDLESAVYNAFSIAEEGDNVLLSPGYSSFDMFRHYQHRGEEFKRIVGEIEAASAARIHAGTAGEIGGS